MKAIDLIVSIRSMRIARKVCVEAYAKDVTGVVQWDMSRFFIFAPPPLRPEFLSSFFMHLQLLFEIKPCHKHYSSHSCPRQHSFY